MKLFPLLTGRDAHALVTANPVLDGQAREVDGAISFAPYPGLPLVLMRPSRRLPYTCAGRLAPLGPLPGRRATRLPLPSEDLYCPGWFTWSITGEPELSFEIAASTRLDPLATPPSVASASGADEAKVEERLRRAAEDFITSEPPGIIAGFPWFGEWGRDTMIALPGLTQASGDLAWALAVIDRYASHRVHGLLPNMVVADPVPSADASLWFVRAVWLLEQRCGVEAVGEAGALCLDIVDALRAGSAPGIAPAANGLLAAGGATSAAETGAAPTWMDAQVDGRFVTPRAPFAVEVNALYHAALAYGALLAERAGRRGRASELRDEADRCARAFRETFWLAREGYLADAHDGIDPDPSLRPNQLFALSGPEPLLSGDEAASVLRRVEAELLTPLGLRTLAPGDAAYRGRCQATSARATSPITRARSGRGCWVPMSMPSPAFETRLP